MAAAGHSVLHSEGCWGSFLSSLQPPTLACVTPMCYLGNHDPTPEPALRETDRERQTETEG